MEAAKEVRTLNLDDILPNRFQPRIKFSEKTIMGLAESIKKHGVIEPIVVRPISDKFEIIAGERRYKASVLAGKTTIPAIITSLDDKNSAEVALIENVQRENLTPIEEAISYRKILDMGYMNQTELAIKLGKTQSTVANKLRLLNLEEEVQEALLDENISERHARSLLKLKGKTQIDMLHKIMKERLTVRATDDAIEKELQHQEEDDIEILDFDDDIEGGEIVNNQFNIPGSPIIEPQSNQQVPETQSPNYNNQASINPGFMDVDQIVNQAEDIYQAPRPEPSLSTLLKTEVKEEPQPVQTVPPVEKESEKNKFFNMFSFPEQPESNPNYVENLEKKEVNMDFGMNQQVVPPVFNPFDVAEPQPQSNQIMASAEVSEPIQSNPFAGMTNPANGTSNVVNQEQVTANNSASTQTPVYNPFEETVATQNQAVFSQEQQVPEVENIQPGNLNQSFYSLNDDDMFGTPNAVPAQPETPAFHPQPVVPTEPVQMVQPVQQFEPIYDILEEEPAQQPVNVGGFQQSAMSSPVTPIYDILDDETEDDQSATNTPVAPVNYTAPSTIGTQTVTVSPTQAPPDLRMVINMIRNCAEEIERYGYVVDLEELDFENKYQVNFKIDKKG